MEQRNYRIRRLLEAKFIMATKLSVKDHWLSRCVAALAAVGIGFGLRLGLTALVGEGLPTYITFYPVIMAVALFGGFGPGLLATLLTALGVDYWILSPTHTFAIANLVDAVGLAFFSGMGVFMSVVAELYRRARQKVTVHETEAVLREGGEAPPAAESHAGNWSRNPCDEPDAGDVQQEHRDAVDDVEHDKRGHAFDDGLAELRRTDRQRRNHDRLA